MDVAQELTVAELDAKCEALYLKGLELDKLDAERKILNEEYSKLEHEVIAYLQAFNKERYSAHFGTVSVVNRFSYKVPKTPEAREKFFNYLKEKGDYDALISVNSQTLNAYCKTELEAAVERGDSDFTVPGLDEPTLFQRAQIRKK
jgi:hypothetical protein